MRENLGGREIARRGGPGLSRIHVTAREGRPPAHGARILSATALLRSGMGGNWYQ